MSSWPRFGRTPTPRASTKGRVNPSGQGGRHAVFDGPDGDAVAPGHLCAAGGAAAPVCGLTRGQVVQEPSSPQLRPS